MIDVERVKLALLQRKPTTSRFNLPLTCSQAKDSMKAAVMAEVEHRQMKFAENEALYKQLSLMAERLTTNDRCFCLLLCGKCGNGKSILVKAFQNLLNLLGLRDEYGNAIGFSIVDDSEIAWMCRDHHRLQLFSLIVKFLDNYNSSNSCNLCVIFYTCGDISYFFVTFAKMYSVWNMMFLLVILAKTA